MPAVNTLVRFGAVLTAAIGVMDEIPFGFSLSQCHLQRLHDAVSV